MLCRTCYFLSVNDFESVDISFVGCEFKLCEVLKRLLAFAITVEALNVQ